MTAARTLLALVLLQLIGCAKPPSDQVLIDRFTREQQSFERLVQLAQEPSHVKMIPTGAYSFDADDSTKTMRPIMKPAPDQKPDPRDEKVRFEEQAIMKKLHIDMMLPGKHGVTFLATGIMESELYGFDKGWEYIPEAGAYPGASHVVSSLDGIEPDLEPYERRYRSLGDGWYLFLQSNHD